MKKYISIIALLSFFMIGCSEQTSANSPIDNVNTNEPNWIALPMGSGSNIENQFSTSGWINKGTDSEFIIDKSRPGGFRGEIKTIVKIKFYAGSVSKNSFMTLTADDLSSLCTFGPRQTFLKPGELYVKYEGLDLTGINADEIDFVYMNANGVYESIQYGEIKVDIQSGILELKDGKIPHFSRYGFIRKEEE